MLKLFPSLSLLAYPFLLMGIIQFIFGFLSFWIFEDRVTTEFLYPAIAVSFFSIWLILLKTKTDINDVSYRASMLFVTLTWIFSGLIASIPIKLIENISLTDAIFESISALTTTGATILTGLDDKPKTLLMYRQFLQWFGGLGVVIFVVAILPMLNVGGMRVLKAETPGPIKDEKLVPRITKSAQYLWYIYVGLTILCCLGYIAAGMSTFEAIAHSFSTVSTGGFSTHDASIGYFDSAWVEVNADIFMILGAISFALHFKFTQEKTLKIYSENEETKVFLYTIALLSILIILLLFSANQYSEFSENIRKSSFHLISFITSTGFASGNFTEWPLPTALVLIVASYLGGCAGSTAGGNKIIRNILSFKIIRKQILQLIHPRGVFLIQINGNTISQKILSATTAFMTLSASISIFITLILMSTGLDFFSSFSAVSSCLNVLGPAFGVIASNFQPISDFGTWVLIFAMLLGRLEFFTILVIFSKLFWGK